jgi:hypothetical protein
MGNQRHQVVYIHRYRTERPWQEYPGTKNRMQEQDLHTGTYALVPVGYLTSNANVVIGPSWTGAIPLLLLARVEESFADNKAHRLHHYVIVDIEEMPAIRHLLDFTSPLYAFPLECDSSKLSCCARCRDVTDVRGCKSCNHNACATAGAVRKDPSRF